MTTEPIIRVLRPGDEPALESFLRPLTDTSMFLRGNAWKAGVVDQGQPGQGTYLAAFEGDAIAGVVALFWHGNLCLQAPSHLATLLRELPRHAPRPVAGLSGPWTQVAEARALLGLEQAPTKIEGREALFALALPELRVPDALARGKVRCRLAGPADLPVLARFRYEFLVGTIGEAPGSELERQAYRAVEISAAEGNLFLVEREGQIVSTAAFNARLPDAVQLGGVYTPPALCNRGYGRAVTAGSLLLARGEGVSRAVLFTQEQGPARRAYEAIGFQCIGDYGLVLFR